MTTLARRIAPLGDLVVDAFDKATLLSADPREISRLAAQAITRELMAAWVRRPGRKGAAAAWSRLLFQCVNRPSDCWNGLA